MLQQAICESTGMMHEIQESTQEFQAILACSEHSQLAKCKNDSFFMNKDS